MKSFKKFLNEMTMRAGNLDDYLQKSLEHFAGTTLPKAQHVGDIDYVKVMRVVMGSIVIDFLEKSGKKIGMAFGEMIKVKKKTFKINEWYVIPEEQRHGLGAKYLYFLKNVLKTPVLLGPVHSDATQEFLKKQDRLKRFEISWYNTRTKEFDEFKNDKYSTAKPTEWLVLIESDDLNENQVFNQFRESDVGLRNNYGWLFDGLENM